MSLGDFSEFKTLMLAHKKQKNNGGFVELNESGLLTVFGVQVAAGSKQVS